MLLNFLYIDRGKAHVLGVYLVVAGQCYRAADAIRIFFTQRDRQERFIDSQLYILYTNSVIRIFKYSLSFAACLI